MSNTLDHYLETADGAGKLMAHAKLLIKLSRLYRDLAPQHLSQASTLANYKSGTLIIHAENGAVAAKLRQMAPRLAVGFAQKGVECNDLQVKVQAREKPAQSTPSTLKPLTSGAVGALQGLRDTLPGSPLRTALDDLLARSAREE